MPELCSPQSGAGFSPGPVVQTRGRKSHRASAYVRRWSVRGAKAVGTDAVLGVGFCVFSGVAEAGITAETSGWLTQSFTHGDWAF